jgi:hypothetical protein
MGSRDNRPLAQEHTFRARPFWVSPTPPEIVAIEVS